MRRERVAEELQVNPAPGFGRQAVLFAQLEELLVFFGPAREYRPMPAPVELRITPYDVVQPDLVASPQAVVKQKGMRNFIEEPPLLVVAILSRSTFSTDRRAKIARYARFGITEYWIGDPDSATLNACLLEDQINRPIPEHPPGKVRFRVFPRPEVTVDSLFG